MAKFVYGMHQSLDGYIAALSGGPEVFKPGPELFRHFLDHVRGISGMLYGTRIYDVMRYWDVDQPGWGPMEYDFAVAWRSKPKWIMSRSLTAVGSHAILVHEELEVFARRLKAEVEGEIDVAGAELAGSVSALGLMDEYRLYLRPLVLGAGKPYFAGALPRMRFLKSDMIGQDAVRVTCVPAETTTRASLRLHGRQTGAKT